MKRAFECSRFVRLLVLIVATTSMLVQSCRLTASQGDLIRNAGFEEWEGDLPTGWTLDRKVRDKGTLGFVLDPVHGGTASLTLRPNRKNAGTEPFRAPGVAWAEQAVADNNGRFHRGGPGEIRIDRRNISLGTAFSYDVPKHSIVSIEIESR